jgi:cadmium resistance transport/sequestration family protein
VVGHYFGFAALVTLSILGSLGVLVVSEQWIGLMGLVPVFLGVRALARLREDSGEESKPVEVTGVYSVAAITFTNGGDNIGIYVPIFASVGFTRMVTIVLVFFALLALWCYAGYKLGNHPTVADVINRYGRFIVPFVLVALGVYIIAESGILFFLSAPSS